MAVRTLTVMARVKERPSGVPGTPSSYRVQWRMGGRKGTDQSCTFPTETMAIAAQALLKSRQNRMTDVEVYAVVHGFGGSKETKQAPTLAEFANGWIAERRKLEDIQADTLDGYFRIIMRRILPRLGQLPISAIDDDARKEWLGWLRQQPSPRGGTLSPNTIMRAHGVLHSLLADAVPKWLPRNPCAKPSGSRKRGGLPKVVQYDAVFLTKQEIALILKHCPPLVRDMVFVAVRTGLRLGELLVLRVQDVTVTGKRKVVRVRRALKNDGAIGPPKSKKSRRDVTISKDVADVIAKCLEGKRQTALVFTAPRGGQWSPGNLRNRYWVPALAAAQRCPEHPPPVPKKGKTGPARKLRPDEVSTCDCPTRLHRVPRWHDLRHTHVSLCVEAGWQPVRVQHRVGHESVSTTMNIYGHLWESTDDDRLDAIERLLVMEEDEAA